MALIEGFWRRPWLHAGWVVAAVGAPMLAYRRQTELMGCYLPASERILHGLPLPGPEWWVYPPAFTLPVLPLIFLPIAVARLVWAVLLISCVVGGTGAVWKAAMQDSAFRAAMQRPVAFVMFVLGLAVTSVGHAVVPLTYQSHDPIVFALLCLAAWAMARQGSTRRDSERTVGLSLGLAASFKVMPFLFLPCLVVAGRWRAAMVMAITGVAVAIGFDLVSLVTTGAAHFQDWLRLASGGADLGASGGGRWGAWNPLNQSGTGILHRLMVPTPEAMGLRHECMLVRVGPEARRFVLLAWVAGIVGLLLLVSWRAWRSKSDAVSPPIRALAWVGAVACGALLVAPQASNYHFAPVGIAAAAMLAWMACRRVDPWLLAVLVPMAIIECMPGRDVLGGRWTDIKLAYGAVGLCAFLACLGASRVAWLAGRPAPVPGDAA